MLRNSFWKKFKLKTDKNYIDDSKDKNDKNLMNLVKPISLKQVKKLPNKKLQIFIDDVISNKKINNLLFLSAAKKEIDSYFREKNKVLKNMNLLNFYNINYKKKISECQELLLKKKNDKVFKTINEEMTNFKIEKEKENKRLKIKFKSLYRNKNINIHNFENLATKLFFKPVNDIRYSSYQRSLKYCLEKCKSEPNFKMPDVSLDMNNVYSRLYHNFIFSPIKKNKNSGKKISIKTLNFFPNKKKFKKSTSITEIINSKKKFNIKIFFKEFKGKEFLIFPSFSARKMCWKKNSGGPGVRPEPSGKIKLNKFKRNQTFEKYYFNSDNLVSNENDDIIDVNDYKNENQESNLHLAVKNNNEQLVKYFLDKNYDPNEQNINGDTPLHLAINLKNANIVNLLLNDKGNVNIKNNQGITPYDLADRELKSKINMYLNVEN